MNGLLFILCLALFLLVLFADAPRPSIRWGLFAIFVVGSAIGPPFGIAFAQTVAPPATVALPYGAWLTALSGLATPIVLAGIGWLLRHLPAQIAATLKAVQADQLLARAVMYGINSVAGAEAGKVLTVEVGNAVAAQAGQYVIDHGPERLVAWLGGSDKITEKIIARLNLEPAAAVTATPVGPVLVAAPVPIVPLPAAPAAP